MCSQVAKDLHMPANSVIVRPEGTLVIVTIRTTRAPPSRSLRSKRLLSERASLQKEDTHTEGELTGQREGKSQTRRR